MSAKVVSADSKKWTRIESVSGQARHEAPVVVFWNDKFYIDEWKGIAVYESEDGIQYNRNNLQVAELEIQDGKMVCDRDK